jgi:hypothetical protein
MANPGKVNCNLKSVIGLDVMTTRERIMGSPPIVDDSLVSVSRSGTTLTISFSNAFKQGFAHATVGTFDAPQFSGVAEDGVAGCTGTQSIVYKDLPGTTNSITWTAPADANSWTSVTLSFAGSETYGAISRRAIAFTNVGGVPTAGPPGSTTIQETLPSTTSRNATVTSPNAAPSVSSGKITVQLDSSASMQYELSPDKKEIEFTVSLAYASWLSLGVSTDGKMGSSGKGSDIVLCSAGTVSRYWVTGPVAPINGVDMPRASCTFVGGRTSMTFKREVAAVSTIQRAISTSPGTCTNFILAYGNSMQTSLSYHGGRAGSKSVDVGTGAVGATARLPASNLIKGHTVCMTLSWGLLVPVGIVMARHLKGIDRKFAGKKIWFQLHRGIQALALLLMTVGFGFAFSHVNGLTGVAHFVGNFPLHSLFGLLILLLGWFQPFNAFLRPHPHPDRTDDDSWFCDRRTCWEWLHKSTGYVAAVLGLLNCILGGVVANSKNLELIVVTTPVVVAVVTFFGTLVLYLAVEVVQCLKQAKDDLV